jgi:hypothetical protein
MDILGVVIGVAIAVLMSAMIYGNQHSQEG